ncbi:LRR receptor-like serine/threonine-protein kinase IOS1-like protein, partial [Drosera capensis]
MGSHASKDENRTLGTFVFGELGCLYCSCVYNALEDVGFARMLRGVWDGLANEPTLPLYTPSWKVPLLRPDQSPQIATQTAQGLAYLHYGCKPPIIHRDLKASNILLDSKLQAKIGDFGLSRILSNESKSHVSTDVAGTYGYMDPEPNVEDGNINDIIDMRLQRSWSINSAWKTLEIAMGCAPSSAAVRPTMSQVVVDLKECLDIQSADERDDKMQSSMRPDMIFDVAAVDTELAMEPEA